MEHGMFEKCQMKIGQRLKTGSRPTMQIGLEGWEQIVANEKRRIQKEEANFNKGLDNARKGVFNE